MNNKYANKFWRHYKGKLYQSIGLAFHTEAEIPTAEPLVIYRSLYADPPYPFGQIWCRPEKMWSEPSPLPEQATLRRFEPVEIEEIPRDVLCKLEQLNEQ